jgi:hypothetical protein
MLNLGAQLTSHVLVDVSFLTFGPCLTRWCE